MNPAADPRRAFHLGVVIFSGSLPATGIAVGSFNPLFLTSARAVIAAVLGAALLLVLRQARPGRGDLLMVAAILLCGLGYAEGAALSRKLGGWQVISWALVLSLPVMAAMALATLPAVWDGISASAWLCLADVSVFSMLIGFVFWYRGLALGGIAGVGQLQLLQPLLIYPPCHTGDDMRIKLARDVIEGLDARDKSDLFIWDTTIVGLGVRVKA